MDGPDETSPTRPPLVGGSSATRRGKRCHVDVQVRRAAMGKNHICDTMIARIDTPPPTTPPAHLVRPAWITRGVPNASSWCHAQAFHPHTRIFLLRCNILGACKSDTSQTAWIDSQMDGLLPCGRVMPCRQHPPVGASETDERR